MRQRQAVKKTGLAAMLAIILLGCLMMILGCGSGTDIMGQQPGVNYSARLHLNGDATSNTEFPYVDTVPQLCDPTDPNSGEDYWPDFYGTIFITVEPDAVGVLLESYTVEYLPISDSDTNGGPATTPALVNPRTHPANVYIEPNTEYGLPILLVSENTKYEFDKKRGWYYYDETLGDWTWDNATIRDFAEDDQGVYTIRVTLRFAESDTVLVADRTTYWGAYAICSN